MQSEHNENGRVCKNGVGYFQGISQAVTRKLISLENTKGGPDAKQLEMGGTPEKTANSEFQVIVNTVFNLQQLLQ